MPAVHSALGIFLLLFGRRLYWIFVAISGFLVGIQLADVVLGDHSHVFRILAAVAAGGAGACIAIMVQRVGFALGGMYAGGYLALGLAGMAGSTDSHWLWFAIGGIVGAILAAALMDWAVIMLSSLVGSGAIVTMLGLSAYTTAILFTVLAIAGIVVQSAGLRAGDIERAHAS